MQLLSGIISLWSFFQKSNLRGPSGMLLTQKFQSNILSNKKNCMLFSGAWLWPAVAFLPQRLCRFLLADLVLMEVTLIPKLSPSVPAAMRKIISFIFLSQKNDAKTKHCFFIDIKIKQVVLDKSGISECFHDKTHVLEPVEKTVLGSRECQFRSGWK